MGLIDFVVLHVLQGSLALIHSTQARLVALIEVAIPYAIAPKLHWVLAHFEEFQPGLDPQY